MSSTLLERTRALHEEIEVFEKAIVDGLLETPKTVHIRQPFFLDQDSNFRCQQRDTVLQQHLVKKLLDEIICRRALLKEIYEDKDGARRDELYQIQGQGTQLFERSQKLLLYILFYWCP